MQGPDFYKPDRAPYLEVARHFRDQIRSGELRPGTRMPSASTIGNELRVSNAVARRALALLKREGLTEAHAGRGTFVRAMPALGERMVSRDDPEVAEAIGRLADAGQVVDLVQEVVTARMPSADEAEHLKVAPGVPLLIVVREYRSGESVVESEEMPALPADLTRLRYTI